MKLLSVLAIDVTPLTVRLISSAKVIDINDVKRIKHGLNVETILLARWTFRTIPAFYWINYNKKKTDKHRMNMRCQPYI